MSIRMKLSVAFARIAAWNPPPYVAHCRDGPLSWWFWRKFGWCELCYERNWLGEKWYSFWFWLCRKVDTL